MRLIDADDLIGNIRCHCICEEWILDMFEAEINEQPIIDAVPVGCLELEKRDCSFADACDMGSSYERERERACNNIIEWWKSPSYDRCLQVATKRGFVQKKWK